MKDDKPPFNDSGSDEEKDPFSGLPEDERIHAENEILRLKLHTEFGATDSESDLDPQTENQWLKNMYTFEKKFAENKSDKLYNLLGAPEFTAADLLSSAEISKELERLTRIMEDHQMRLDTIYDYDDEVIYRFITEELFNEEFSDVTVPGMTQHFIYEEFHPNHEKDIEGKAIEFIETLLLDDWEENFANRYLTSTITYNGNAYNHHSFSEIIKVFQAAQFTINLEELKIDLIQYDIDSGRATLNGNLSYYSEQTNQQYKGHLYLELQCEFEWHISLLIVPGFSSL